MGKRIISQRRGRGTFTYRAPSHHYVAAVKHRQYDEIERSGMVNGIIVDLVDCPGHSAPLAQVKYENNDKGYIFAAEGMKMHDTIASGFNAPVKVGCTLPLKKIPEGTHIYNIEVRPEDKGKLVRAGGSSAQIVGITEHEVTVMMPSRKKKVFHPLCRATIGIIAGSGRKEKPFMKAGKRHHAMRATGKLYPRTSGVAMNAVDHPFGSGRGRHVGKPKTVSRHAPPGRKVGKIAARRTGRRR